jgi:hypothetical protein
MAALSSDIPSRRRTLLAALLGQRALRIVRYSWVAPEQAVREYALTAPQVFGRTAGPIALEFESGLILGVASQPSENAVVVWWERDEHGATQAEPLSQAADLSPVSADDPRYADASWATLLGARLMAIRVFRSVGRSAKEDAAPSETALEFQFERGPSLFCVHGLHDNSDDFSILHEPEILPELRRALHESFTLTLPS